MKVEVLAPEGDLATILWLHGMGQEPDVMVSAARRMGLLGGGLRGVFPAAPERATRRFSEKPVTAWFEQDIYHLHKVNVRSALTTEEQLRSVVADEIELADHRRVIIAGFSQGAVAGLMLGARYPGMIAGLVLYACYLPAEIESLLAATRRLPSRIPVWLGHGTRDHVIPYRTGQRVRDTLASWGYPVTWQSYRTGHDAFGCVRYGVRDFLSNAVGLKPPGIRPEE